jgi:dimethylargininase
MPRAGGGCTRSAHDASGLHPPRAAHHDRGMPSVLVRPPSPRLADGELTHLDRVPVDPALARRQWEGYLQAWRSVGWATIEVPSADEFPDGVFVEDAVVVFGRTAVLTSPGADSRRGELATVSAALAGTGLEVVRIEAPATLDGGDVLKVGDTVYVGRSSRTNEHGIEALARIVEPLGYRVRPVTVTKVLHLKSAVTALPDGTVIGHPPEVDDPGAFETFLAVPEAAGSAVVVVDGATVLLSASAPRTAALLRERGLTVVQVEVGEFEKLEGCVTCLSVRLRD